MTSGTELKIDYNSEMKPVSASCTGCGEKMPLPPSDLRDSAEIIMWLSMAYLEHRKLKHSQGERRRVPRD